MFHDDKAALFSGVMVIVNTKFEEAEKLQLEKVTVKVEYTCQIYFTLL